MTILLGKKIVIPTWHFKLIAQPRFVVDLNYDQTFAADQLPALDNDPFENISTEIFYDENLLARHRFIQRSDLLLEQDFQDAADLPDHELKVIFDGLNIENNFVFAGQHLTVGVFVKIYVEGVDCDWYLHDRPGFLTSDGKTMIGQSFVSQNGTHVIKLGTPIYQWLFDNENLIVSQYAKNT
jgi:hypothetical protein